VNVALVIECWLAELAGMGFHAAAVLASLVLLYILTRVLA
jgi:hypothetical protein